MAEQRYFSMLTPYGKSVSRNVFNGGQPVILTQMAVGYGTEDTGNGSYTPTEDQEDLVNEWLRFDLNSLSIDPKNPAWLIAEGIIREDIGGHWINEVSVIDNTGGVVAICAWPPTYKPTLPEGSSSAAVIRAVIEVSDTNNFVLVIDTSLALVTRDEFLNSVGDVNNATDLKIQAHNIDSNAHEDIRQEIAALNEVDSADLVSEDEGNAISIGTDGRLFAAAIGGGGDSGNNGNGLILGSRWLKTASPTALMRLHASIGVNFTPAVNGVGGSSDFDTLPIYKDIRLCNVVNGVVTAYQGEPGFSRTPATGDVMVEIPQFYYKIIDTSTTRDYLISDVQHDNTWLVSPRHAPTTSKPAGCDKIYVAAYTSNSSYQSKSGNATLVNITRDVARQGSAGRGAGYCQYDYATYATIQLLYLVEVADWDSQAAVGQGNVNTSGQINTGSTDGIGFHSGSTVAGDIKTGTVKYRHMENLWGNLYQWVDGININDRQAYIAREPSQYADDTTANYNALSYVNYSGSGEFIKSLGFDNNYPWAQICFDGGGADGTFVPDRYYSNTGWRVLCVGGNYANSTNAGLFCFYGTYESTYSSSSVGCRLLYIP